MGLKELIDSNEQLDAILKCLNYHANEVDKITEFKNDDGSVIKEYVVSHSHNEYRKISDFHLDLASICKAQMNNLTIKLALEYLSNEKMVTYQSLSCPGHGEISGYRILYKGKKLIENGGYKNIANQEKFRDEQVSELQTRQDQMAKRLFWINLTIAVGTSVAAIYYLDQLCTEHHWLWYSCH